MYPEYLKNKLLENVKYVRNMLDVLNIHEEFYIAGGSVFAILNEDRHYADIDVYFYKEPKFLDDIPNSIQNLKCEFLSISLFSDTKYAYSLDVKGVKIPKTARTISTPTGNKSFLNAEASSSLDVDNSKLIQLLKYNYGNPKDVFKEFDINHSKFAITESGEIISDCLVTDNIQVNFNWFKAGSYRRFEKYTNLKYSIDKDNIEFKRILDFLLNDLFVELPGSYNNEKVTRVDELKGFDRNLFRKYEDYAHNKIVELYTEEQQLIIFEKLKYLFRPLESFCDECLLPKILFSEESDKTLTNTMSSNDGVRKDLIKDLSTARVNIVKSNYPEYFI